MARKRSIKEQIFIYASALFFLGSFTGTIISVINAAKSQPVAAAQAELEDPLHSQLKGYEIVLKREPNNPVALEGLANTYLEMNNPKGAIAPLETLINLYPDRDDYVTQLTTAKQDAAQDQQVHPD